MNITLRQLEIFIAIATYGNVTRAADKLLLSQSAASMALAELESQLDQNLFTRSGKKLALNEAGRALLPRAAELLERAREMSEMFAPQGRELTGMLNIGASSTIGNYLIPEYVGKFSNSYPAVEISLEVGNTDQIITSLLNFSIDIGYIEGLCNHRKITAIPWRKDRLVIFASPENRLAKKKRIKLEDLAGEKWILRERGSGTREIFENAIAGKIQEMNIAFEFGHTEAIKNAVMNNLGISCLSVLTLAELLKTKRVVEIKTPFLDLTRNFYSIMHKEKYNTAVLNRFREYISRQHR